MGGEALDPGAGRRPRFMVDHMLIKLSRYLRILGLDASHVPGERTHALIERANAEGRIFLTRNTRIDDQYPPPLRLLFVAKDDPVEQLRDVVTACGIDPREGLFSRCIRCNVELEELEDLDELGERAARVPARVRARHRRFWTCPSCGTIFWHGTHVRNTLEKLGLAPAGSGRDQREGESAPENETRSQ